MRPVIIFGSTGMLGNYVKKYFELNSSKSVICINRDIFDVLINDLNDLEKIYETFPKNSVIINCIGLIPQIDNKNKNDFYRINSVFPKELNRLCNEFSFKLIHTTTDCVFSGKLVNDSYDELSKKDAIDDYGKSKYLGEDLPGACIIRTSIIGEQFNTKLKQSELSLLEWVKSNKNGNINGYKNHYWNGITCLEFAKIVYNMIDQNTMHESIRHIFSEKVSKYELLELINEIYSLNIKIKPIETTMVNRTMKTIYLFRIKDLKTQIQELYDSSREFSN